MQHGAMQHEWFPNFRNGKSGTLRKRNPPKTLKTPCFLRRSTYLGAITISI